MKRHQQLFACLMLCAGLVGVRPEMSAVSAQPVGVLHNADIVTLVGAGLDSDVIVLKIETSAFQFDTSADALAVLKAARAG